MADEIDRAQERDALNLSDALAAHQLRAHSTVHLVGIGECLNPRCGEPFEAANDNGRLFCGPGCEAEHRRLSRA